MSITKIITEYADIYHTYIQTLRADGYSIAPLDPRHLIATRPGADPIVITIPTQDS